MRNFPRQTRSRFDAAAEGRFLIKRCTACGEAHWYPRAMCPFCHSDKTVWEESKGEGVVYSFSILRKSPTGPYALAYVTQLAPTLRPDQRIVVNLSGRGDKDIYTVARLEGIQL